LRLVASGVFVLAAGGWGAAAGAEKVERAEIRAGDLTVTWDPGPGLEAAYAGIPLFVPCHEPLVLHPPDWSTAYYRSSDHRPEARLERQGDVQVLTLVYPDAGFRCTQTIAVGPGSRFRVEYVYGQDRWDDVGLQLGFSRPSQEFWSGARFVAAGEDKRVEGVIPEAYDPEVGAHPFAGATDVTVTSVWGSLGLTCTKPVALWDYPKRPQGFFLGFDQAMPRGEEMRFGIGIALSPPRVEAGGAVICGLRIPSSVEDGLLRASLSVARTPTGLKQARISLRAETPGGKELVVEEKRTLALEPASVDFALRTPGPGRYGVALVVADPAGRELFRSPQRTVRVAPLVSVRPGRLPYTGESEGVLIVRTASGLRGKRLAVEVSCAGKPLLSGRAVVGGERTLVRFPLASVPDGASTIRCVLRQDGAELAFAEAPLLKCKPKANEVKIDYVSRGLIVDGRPFLPFGFYCVFPFGDLPEVEATQGFVHIAPYQSAAGGHSPEKMSRIRAYLDRCAALGIRVHYDIRAVAQSPPSEKKWELLRAEVEAIRDHPALLCWYLCDEPAGQGIDPAVLDEAYRFVKELDPHHPVTMVFCVPQRAPEYVNGMDIIMADPYPIPNRSVTMVSDWTDSLNRAVDYGMPLWIVPQAFGGGEGWAREPSAQEERVMTYLALIHDATGIQYFVRRAPIGNPISPSLWSECRRLALEAAELTPFLLSHEPRPAASCESASVHVAAWRDRGQVLVLAANGENRPADVRLDTGVPEYTGAARVLFENRSVDVTAGVIAEPIDAFGTRAYVVPVGPAPAEDLTIDPRNLTRNPSYEDAANVGTPDGCYVGVGADRGASLFVDPQVARHGRRSLRVTTPTEGRGLTIMPFPVPLSKGASYRLSIWARAQQPGAVLELGVNGLDVERRTFELTTAWRQYELTGTAPETLRRGGIRLRLVSAGTAWLDLLQLVPMEGR